jgi:Family of unknown function (DUF6065)
MHEINLYKIRSGYADVNPLTVKREWMDETYDAHAYKCFPVSMANNLGWGISFPEDISFIWDGISDSTSDHVKIIKGEKYIYTERANATISFNTGLMFETEKDVSLVSMPVPNQFIDGAQAFTTIISSSFYRGELPCAWRITKANSEITIKANTPILAILPINLLNLQNSEITEKPINQLPPSKFNDKEYSEKVYATNLLGKWSNFYRNATDHIGNKIGEHQVKTIKLKVNTIN